MLFLLNKIAFLGLPLAAIFAITIISISITPTTMAKSDANGQPDLVTTLTAKESNGVQSKALFRFNDDG